MKRRAQASAFTVLFAVAGWCGAQAPIQALTQSPAQATQQATTFDPFHAPLEPVKPPTPPARAAPPPVAAPIAAPSGDYQVVGVVVARHRAAALYDATGRAYIVIAGDRLATGDRVKQVELGRVVIVSEDGRERVLRVPR